MEAWERRCVPNLRQEGSDEIRFYCGDLRDGTDESGQRVERVPRRRLTVPAECERSARAQRARTDDSSMRERRSLVAYDAGNRSGRATFAGARDAAGIHEAICGTQRQTAGATAGEGRSVEGGRDEVFRCRAVARVGDDAADSAHGASPGAADGDAEDAGA